VGAELLHAADGRTNMTKLIVAFRNFANAPINGSLNVQLGLWIEMAAISSPWTRHFRGQAKPQSKYGLL